MIESGYAFLVGGQRSATTLAQDHNAMVVDHASLVACRAFQHARVHVRSKTLCANYPGPSAPTPLLSGFVLDSAFKSGHLLG